MAVVHCKKIVSAMVFFFVRSSTLKNRGIGHILRNWFVSDELAIGDRSKHAVGILRFIELDFLRTSAVKMNFAMEFRLY